MKIVSTNYLRSFVFGMLILLLSIPMSGGEISSDDKMLSSTVKDVSFVEAVKEISQRFNVFFTFDLELVEGITVDDAFRQIDDVENAVEYVLHKTELNYRIIDMRYVIMYKNDQEGINSLKEMSKHLDGLIHEGERGIPISAKRDIRTVPRLPMSLRSKMIDRIVFTVNGTVTDQEGKPLIGVNIQVKGSSKGTATDFDGRFTLEDIDENAVLVISYVGYQTQEVSVAGKSDLEIVMISDSQLLDEVVVVGYGTQKKANLTGAVDAISGDALQNRSVALVSDLIKGASPNLNITMGMRGGEPGASSSWNIRGIGSINANAAPLILVDGVEVNINNIDPESIESISVLKDASASAIYGSRAPFGVVLITTKKGSQGKMRVEYSNNIGMNKPMRISSFVDAMTWATAYNQANANAGLPPVYSNEQVERIQGYMDGTFPYEYDPENPIDNIWAGRRNGNANYDWPRVLLADQSFNQKHNINLSGGSENTNFFLSGGFVDQDGIYRYGYDNYKRLNLLSNLNSQVNDWLNVRSSIKYAKGMSDYPVGQTTVGREHMIGEMLTFAPMMPMYNINGTYQSPLIRWQQDSGRDKWQTNDFFVNLGADIEPIKGWITSFS